MLLRGLAQTGASKNPSCRMQRDVLMKMTGRAKPWSSGAVADGPMVQYKYNSKKRITTAPAAPTIVETGLILCFSEAKQTCNHPCGRRRSFTTGPDLLQLASVVRSFYRFVAKVPLEQGRGRNTTSRKRLVRNISNLPRR